MKAPAGFILINHKRSLHLIQISSIIRVYQDKTFPHGPTYIVLMSAVGDNEGCETIEAPMSLADVIDLINASS